MRQGRKRRLHTRSAGLVCGLYGTVDFLANKELAEKRVEVLFEEVAAIIGEPGDSAFKKIAFIVGEEGLEAALHFGSTRVAQI
eukprot:6180621-Pleurochrysis_carterae.AAC.1